jgi:hypothetical protein
MSLCIFTEQVGVERFSLCFYQLDDFSSTLLSDKFRRVQPAILTLEMST